VYDLAVIGAKVVSGEGVVDADVFVSGEAIAEVRPRGEGGGAAAPG
jgi:hypothetical protein